MVQRDNKNMLEMMFKYFPDETLGIHCLWSACKHGSVGCVDAVLQHVHVLYSKTPMMTAARHGKSDVVKHLVTRYHANYYGKDSDGFSALSYAIGCNWVDTARLLVELGAGHSKLLVPNAADVKIWTMSGYASTGKGGSEEMARYLKTQGIVYKTL
eukprot:TRINITY_DN15821_c0_g1_i1.p1 TRINITY_DN15821_c0_g1~~TRINITY_DN15821_c0_g1_i1.p1  ORF type:complete len:165 (-),score=26.99 TRINITY_DN15821_c0_g1_i1:98-565(-)